MKEKDKTKEKDKVQEEKETKQTNKFIIAFIILAIVILSLMVTKRIISNNNKDTIKEENNIQAAYYGKYYGEKIAKIAMMYYLENEKMISSNELNKTINNIEDYKFDNSEVHFSDIKCKKIETNDNGDLKLKDCNSKLFNTKKSYTYETNILDKIKQLTYEDIDSSFAEKSMNGLSKILNIKINITHSIGCDDDEKDGTVKESNYNHKYKYVNVTRNGEETESTQITENDNVDVLICKRINLDSINKKVEVSKIDLNSKLPQKDFKPEILKSLAETIGEATFGVNYKYNYNGGIFYIKDKNDNINEYKNVEKIYYHKGGSCNFYVEFYILTSDKVIPLTLDDIKQYGAKEEKPINETKTYENKDYDAIYSVWVRSTTCGADFKYIAHKNDNNFYDLSTGEKIDMSIKYNYYDILTTDRKFNGYNTKLTIKAVMKDEVIDGIVYLVDTNDYLYKHVYEEDNETITKASDKKVKTIHYRDNSGYIYIEFTDGTFYENNALNLLKLEY